MQTVSQLLTLFKEAENNPFLGVLGCRFGFSRIVVVSENSFKPNQSIRLKPNLQLPLAEV
jgi:hypothetical protein